MLSRQSIRYGMVLGALAVLSTLFVAVTSAPHCTPTTSNAPCALVAGPDPARLHWTNYGATAVTQRMCVLLGISLQRYLADLGYVRDCIELSDLALLPGRLSYASHPPTLRSRLSQLFFDPSRQPGFRRLRTDLEELLFPGHTDPSSTCAQPKARADAIAALFNPVLNLSVDEWRTALSLALYYALDAYAPPLAAMFGQDAAPFARSPVVPARVSLPWRLLYKPFRNLEYTAYTTGLRTPTTSLVFQAARHFPTGPDAKSPVRSMSITEAAALAQETMEKRARLREAKAHTSATQELPPAPPYSLSGLRTPPSPSFYNLSSPERAMLAIELSAMAGGRWLGNNLVSARSTWEALAKDQTLAPDARIPEPLGACSLSLEQFRAFFIAAIAPQPLSIVRNELYVSLLFLVVGLGLSLATHIESPLTPLCASRDAEVLAASVGDIIVLSPDKDDKLD